MRCKYLQACQSYLSTPRRPYYWDYHHSHRRKGKNKCPQEAELDADICSPVADACHFYAKGSLSILGLHCLSLLYSPEKYPSSVSFSLTPETISKILLTKALYSFWYSSLPSNFFDSITLRTALLKSS
jgi:hypothetical protein